MQRLRVSLPEATIVLKRGQSFLQKGKTGALGALAASLGKIVEASWVSSSQRAKVQALLQASAGAEDEDLSLAPQAYSNKTRGDRFFFVFVFDEFFC